MNKSNKPCLSAMSIEDKVALLTGNGLWKTAHLPAHGIEPLTMTDGTYGVRYSPEQIDNDGNWSITDFLGVVNQHADDQTDKKGSEALFGHTLPATCFPNGSALACSWDNELVEQMGQALARECQALGVDILLGPGINIRRTPLSGRGYEYYSEDPLLSGELAASLINGLQGEGVGASLKHFACNNSEYRRTEMDSIVDERSLHEIYLSGFKRAIDKADPWTLMSSYNRLNGQQTSQHRGLLHDILREQWGYKGLVMSDWYGVKDRPASLLAGNDLAMPEVARDKSELLSAIESGEVSIDAIDTACMRMLELIERIGAARKQPRPVDMPAHHRLAQRIAEESIVLLKNTDDLLPLDTTHTHKIAVLGPAAHTPVIQGSGCATTVPSILDRPLDEIIDVAGDAADVTYSAGVADGATSSEQALLLASAQAEAADVAIVFINTAVGEDGENGDRQHLDVVASHAELLNAVASVQSNVVVVLMNSDAVVMPWLGQCKAVLETFFAGQGVGRAIANLLFGLKNPCGKLTVTVPNSLEETPAYLHYPGEALKHYYSEGIYVGYRYYDKRKMTPCFPFGYGLSYTSFEYRSIELVNDKLGTGESLQVDVTVANTGVRFGKEIIQLYLSFPGIELAQPPLALKAYAKVALKPGESKTVRLTVGADDFRAWHPALHDWIVEAGCYQVKVGPSSRELPLSAAVQVAGSDYRLPLKEDSSLVQVIKDEQAFQRVVTLVADKSGLDQAVITERLQAIAPELFCGLFIALTEFLNVPVSRPELLDALRSE
ncbi:beta-glucosidase [Alteromonas lipolytica]|uniref:Glycosyl hydrolase n=1 Tax=Alteromonas lipolytica TaxID=1856405 RepID=A0A1E8FB14_9ALTE|nr:glycoside hydrolase family 3 C-terminal domain-containing protein [Alteromonas lipolytica]OFI32693.1 glycosyl hydrolase [Alteromonas lipolytica]GGF74028.1 glycosyl hydrolase [Alteromonas lipolytica]